ncbi:metal ABC transporter permease [Streptomyces monashensis]|uniref:metal ABC transporter permease n=1 Tax=Streptomyces monashensis TaxID=1678012 RepID=UPI0033C1A05F
MTLLLAASPLSQPLFQHAFLAGTAIAAACGLVGYFLVLRAQVFTGDALSHVAFTGVMAALAFGVDLRLGLFAATIGMALLFGTLGRRARPDDGVIGNVFSWILGLGAFFITLYTTSRSTTNGRAITISTRAWLVRKVHRRLWWSMMIEALPSSVPVSVQLGLGVRSG